MVKSKDIILSIIVPIYNKEQYLEYCLNSLLIIDNFKYEIILVDDGSKDGSLVICKKYSEKYDNVIAIRQSNQGVSAARNTGISYAKGEFVAFVDADDFVKPNFGKQIFLALQTEADFYQFNYTRWIDTSHVSSGKCIFKAGFYSDTKALSKQISGLEICAMSVCMGLYKTSIIRKNNIKFRLGMETCEDFLFNIQYISYINNFYVSNDNGYCYRYNHNSVTHKRGLSHADDYEYIYDALESYLLSNEATQENMDLFQERWVRWTIDLISNWKSQKMTSEDIWNKIQAKSFFIMVIKKNTRLSYRVRFEQFLLRKKFDNLVWIYMKSVLKLKIIIGRHSL